MAGNANVPEVKGLSMYCPVKKALADLYEIFPGTSLAFVSA